MPSIHHFGCLSVHENHYSAEMPGPLLCLLPAPAICCYHTLLIRLHIRLNANEPACLPASAFLPPSVFLSKPLFFLFLFSIFYFHSQGFLSERVRLCLSYSLSSARLSYLPSSHLVSFFLPQSFVLCLPASVHLRLSASTRHCFSSPLSASFTCPSHPSLEVPFALTHINLLILNYTFLF